MKYKLHSCHSTISSMLSDCKILATHLSQQLKSRGRKSYTDVLKPDCFHYHLVSLTCLHTHTTYEKTLPHVLISVLCQMFPWSTCTCSSLLGLGSVKVNEFVVFCLIWWISNLFSFHAMNVPGMHCTTTS